MPGFHKTVATVFAVLVALTSLGAYVFTKRSYLSDALLPAHRSVIPWTVRVSADSEYGGLSSLTVNDSIYGLDFDLMIVKGVEHPYASFGLLFEAFRNSGQLVDLSKYDTLTFNVLCRPHNVLGFSIHTFDDKVTKPADFLTFRTPVKFFSCNGAWKRIEIDLRHLEVPEWWLWINNIELSDREYRLDRVAEITFGMSVQSPVDTVSNVKISELTLHGRDRRYVYAYSLFAAAAWIGFIFGFFKYHTRHLIDDIREKMRRNRQLLVYRKLSVEPQKDREKAELLQFMAKEYANPELSLEMTIETLGINRTKINEILKEEFGFTFTSYLNKLRLTEASRLLSEKEHANVAEIAYSVGYNNVTYFNKLFKNEYGCTPRTFRSLYKPDRSGMDTDRA
jgi:AraC-like DNA-binding protein